MVGQYFTSEAPHETKKSSARAKLATSQVASLSLSPRGNVRVGTASSPFLWAGTERKPAVAESVAAAPPEVGSAAAAKAAASADALNAMARAFHASPPQSPAEAASLAIHVGGTVWGAALDTHFASAARASDVEHNASAADARAALRAEREASYTDRAALAASAGAQVSAAAGLYDSAREEMATLHLRLSSAQVTIDDLTRDAVPRAAHDAALLSAALKLRVREAAAEEAAARANVALKAAASKAEITVKRAEEAHERALARVEADAREKITAAVKDAAAARAEKGVAEKLFSSKLHDADAALNFGAGFGASEGVVGTLLAFRLSSLPPALAHELAWLDAGGTGDVKVDAVRRAAQVFSESAHFVAAGHALEIANHERDAAKHERDAAKHERDAAVTERAALVHALTVSRLENAAAAQACETLKEDVLEAFAAEEAASARAADVPVLRKQLALALCALAAVGGGGAVSSSTTITRKTRSQQRVSAHPLLHSLLP